MPDYVTRAFTKKDPPDALVEAETLEHRIDTWLNKFSKEYAVVGYVAFGGCIVITVKKIQWV